MHRRVLAMSADEVTLEACDGIRDDGLRGECQMTAAQVSGGGEGFGDLCPQVDEGVWRDECFFLAAEHTRRASHDKKAAGALCAQAGVFANDCAQHLWQTGLKRIVDQNLDDLDQAYDHSLELFCYWDPVLGQDTDLRQRFWHKGFGGWFERHGELDLGACSELDELPREHCEKAAAGLYLRRLHMVRPHASACGKSFDELQSLPNLRAVEHPMLVEVATLQQDWMCEQGQGGLTPEAASVLTPSAELAPSCE